MGFLLLFLVMVHIHTVLCIALIVYCTSIHNTKIGIKINRLSSWTEQEKNKSDFGLPFFPHSCTIHFQVLSTHMRTCTHTYTYNLYTICRRFYSWNVRNVDAAGKNQGKWKRSECEKNKCARSTYLDWIGAHFQNMWSDGVFLFSIHLMSVCAANDDIIYWYTLPCRVDRLNIKFSKQSMSHWISHQSDIRAQTAFTDQFCWFFTCEVGERASEWIWMVGI